MGRTLLTARRGAKMHLGGESPTTAAQRLLLLPAGRTSGVLMGAHYRAVKEMRGPVELSSLISLALKFAEHARPYARGRPAAEPIPGGAPRSETLREIAPRRAGSQYPENDLGASLTRGLAVTHIAPTSRDRREQRSARLPNCICYPSPSSIS